MTSLTTDSNKREAPSVSEVIVTAVADADGVSPLNVDPPLARVIDPDALQALVDSLADNPYGQTGTIDFSYNSYDVTVSADGSVSLSNSDHC